MRSPIAATALLEPIPRKPTPPKARARFAARAVCALLRFPTRTVRKPPVVVALATIEPSRTGEIKRRSSPGEPLPMPGRRHASITSARPAQVLTQRSSSDVPAIIDRDAAQEGGLDPTREV